MEKFIGTKNADGKIYRN